MATANTPSQSPLKESIRTDVCIIGAGIAGLTTAYLLAREGRSVVVLDDGVIGGGMTGRTTAHLSNAYDDRYVEIENFTAPRARVTQQKVTPLRSRKSTRLPRAKKSNAILNGSTVFSSQQHPITFSCWKTSWPRRIALD
jgi:flavin-dependent dehydrogenase